MRVPHHCPSCNQVTEKVHDYLIQKIQHHLIFDRQTILFYRKRHYCCENEACQKRFHEDNTLEERYQRQSIEFSQAMGVEWIQGKNSKDVASRFGTSPTTIMRRYDQICAPMLR